MLENAHLGLITPCGAGSSAPHVAGRFHSMDREVNKEQQKSKFRTVTPPGGLLGR